MKMENNVNAEKAGSQSVKVKPAIGKRR